ncbi:hypothetical protein CC1G_06283 [Coprinopsis cinerea okayama7|uniref:Uncharacterized protein n=1 Tax=Coprinopsis cinerea (strain Okayama-7 / 130 / ATCC MYA-4618 / FGSC 9003) TaxID=240176 RepID=A8NTD0_COPC7|nr:hypothetical protein CC1G_06283 [Coprinopsis cinerea okayama7\|eukprot:XP_001836198.2 hypothetical protein CC1G_06283 [Coprinopsis cinerea okayama7\
MANVLSSTLMSRLVLNLRDPTLCSRFVYDSAECYTTDPVITSLQVGAHQSRYTYETMGGVSSILPSTNGHEAMQRPMIMSPRGFNNEHDSKDSTKGDRIDGTP